MSNLEKMRWSDWHDGSARETIRVILTAGMWFENKGQIAGVFACPDDAASPDADELAIAIVGFDDLSPEQQADAEHNSDAL